MEIVCKACGISKDESHYRPFNYACKKCQYLKVQIERNRNHQGIESEYVFRKCLKCDKEFISYNNFRRCPACSARDDNNELCIFSA